MTFGRAMPEMLENLSELSTYVIASACAVHLFVFFVLLMAYRRSLRTMASSLDDFTRNLKHRSVLDSTAHLSDQIEGFLSDIREVIAQPPGNPDREMISQRMHILDEKRRFSQSLRFETSYNVTRTMIEAYPLAGVLGTILAIGAALQTDAATEGESAVSVIVGRFGDAIWSTFAGLAAGILLMFVNSWLEPRFRRLAENRTQARETVAAAKREIALTGNGGGTT